MIKICLVYVLPFFFLHEKKRQTYKHKQIIVPNVFDLLSQYNARTLQLSHCFVITAVTGYPG